MADDGGVLPETLAPERVADNHLAIGAWHPSSRTNRRPSAGVVPNASKNPAVTSDPQVLRLAAAEQPHGLSPLGDKGVEDLLLVAPVEEVAGNHSGDSAGPSRRRAART